jgi:hypothetical protein
VIARSFVAKRTVDDDKIWRRPGRGDLARRGEAYQQPTAAGEQFFGDENCERRANDSSDNAYLVPGKREGIQFGMIAWPACKRLGSSCFSKRPYKVAVGIQQAHRRYRNSCEVLLASRLAQQR